MSPDSLSADGGLIPPPISLSSLICWTSLSHSLYLCLHFVLSGTWVGTIHFCLDVLQEAHVKLTSAQYILCQRFVKKGCWSFMPFKKYEVQCFYIFFGKRSDDLLQQTQMQQHLGKKKKKKKTSCVKNPTRCVKSSETPTEHCVHLRV